MIFHLFISWEGISLFTGRHRGRGGGVGGRFRSWRDIIVIELLLSWCLMIERIGVVVLVVRVRV